METLTVMQLIAAVFILALVISVKDLLATWIKSSHTNSARTSSSASSIISTSHRTYALPNLVPRHPQNWMEDKKGPLLMRPAPAPAPKPHVSPPFHALYPPLTQTSSPTTEFQRNRFSDIPTRLTFSGSTFFERSFDGSESLPRSTFTDLLSSDRFTGSIPISVAPQIPQLASSVSSYEPRESPKQMDLDDDKGSRKRMMVQEAEEPTSSPRKPVKTKKRRLSNDGPQLQVANKSQPEIPSNPDLPSTEPTIPAGPVSGKETQKTEEKNEKPPAKSSETDEPSKSREPNSKLHSTRDQTIKKKKDKSLILQHAVTEHLAEPLSPATPSLPAKKHSTSNGMLPGLSPASHASSPSTTEKILSTPKTKRSRPVMKPGISPTADALFPMRMKMQATLSESEVQARVKDALKTLVTGENEKKAGSLAPAIESKAVGNEDKDKEKVVTGKQP